MRQRGGEIKSNSERDREREREKERNLERGRNLERERGREVRSNEIVILLQGLTERSR